VNEPALPQKIVAIDAALSAAGIQHAFGGALALAYYVDEPRSTADIDVNVTIDADHAEAVFGALPSELEWSRADVDAAVADDQVRLWWGRTPLDIFFRADVFHNGVAVRSELHSFAGLMLPFVAADDLVVFKALFNRPKDWVDIEAMIVAGSVDLAVVRERLFTLIGEDARLGQLADRPVA